jgi:hypothetical protein
LNQACGAVAKLDPGLTLKPCPTLAPGAKLPKPTDFP